ncbi:MAG: replication-associated recombination protein A [Actinomycetia bacterium]|nr:replication-associated recombination protein A [Actinomycetes bacterium]
MTGPDLFESAADDRGGGPLAARMRPRSLDELVGQQHLLATGSPLRRLVEGDDRAISLILFGPPGTGKTTIAHLVSQATGRQFAELSAVTAGVKDVRAVVDHARRRLGMGESETVLFVDEVHRFSKTQQDALLPAVENGWVVLIAATTENPHFAIVAPLLSRSLLVTLQPLAAEDVATLVRRAVDDDRGLAGSVSATDEAVDAIVRLSGGDARRALTILDAAAAGAEGRDGQVGLDDVARAVDKAAIRYDRDGDQHYDVTSALIKSIRGSDVDAALHYLARMIEAGEDPRFIARRLVIHASEDVGMADPSALQTAVAALEASAFVGLPEARIPLAQAVIHLATAPKSNAVVVAIDEALSDIRNGRIGAVPSALRDAHYPGAKELGVQGYSDPHDDPRGVVSQQYAPDPVVGRRYYRPTAHGFELAVAARLERIRAILDDDSTPERTAD